MLLAVPWIKYPRIPPTPTGVNPITTGIWGGNWPVGLEGFGGFGSYNTSPTSEVTTASLANNSGLVKSV